VAASGSRSPRNFVIHFIVCASGGSLGGFKTTLFCAGYRRSALTILPLNVVFSGLIVMFLPIQAEKFLPNALPSVCAFVLLQTTPFVLFLK
jgi:hypothetical protein